MKILAIDTSAAPVSAAIIDDDKLVAEYTLNFKMTHSQTLMPAVDNILKATGTDIKEMDYIACSEGPGSFTGLRIGAATAKGLAHGIGVKVIGVPTLDALAYNVFGSDKIICPIMDARRSQVYSAFYEYENGKLVKIVDEDIRLIEEVEEIAQGFKREIIFVGDGAVLYKERLSQNGNFIVAPQHMNMQRASAVASLAYIYANEGKAVDCNDFAPVYLRKSQAERELEEKKAAEGAEK